MVVTHEKTNGEMEERKEKEKILVWEKERKKQNDDDEDEARQNPQKTAGETKRSKKEKFFLRS